MAASNKSWFSSDRTGRMTMMMVLMLSVLLAISSFTYCHAFVVPKFVPRPTGTLRVPTPTTRHIHQHQQLHMFDPTLVMGDATTMMDTVGTMFNSLPTNTLLSFTDQGQNLAGVFFQASLLPYLLFLYFLQFRANRLPAVGNFGFQFVLLFVLSTIPSGIITKSLYGLSLADTDWLHGGAELLLTVANVLIVLGLKDAMTKPEGALPINKPRLISLGIAGAFFAALALGPSLGVEGHSQFLFGLGNVPYETMMLNMPWITHTEPVNALSIPTWAIHFSSVYEYLFAMNLIWKYSETTNNPTWKGLTWGMLPLHASGICACTYHFFYNPSMLQFLVSMQAGLTLLGNLTCALAAFRIAKSNGWTLDEISPLPKSPTNPTGLVADGIAAMPLQVDESSTESTQALAAKLIGLTLVSSYLIKYGELGLDLPFEPNAPAALALVLGIPAITAFQYYNLSQKDGTSEEGSSLFSFLGFGGKDEDGNDKPSLSMADVKKYGVAGTVAYVLTELAFWIVAFPVAGYALYQSTGHWPDVINETNDRAAVLAFIFAGANIARAFVPVRLGAALALAPWVDENLLSKFGDNDGSSAESVSIENKAQTSNTIQVKPAGSKISSK